MTTEHQLQPFLGAQHDQIYFWYSDTLRLGAWLQTAGLFTRRWTREAEQRSAALRQHYRLAREPDGAALTVDNSHLLTAAWLQQRGAAGLNPASYEEGDINHPGGSWAVKNTNP